MWGESRRRAQKETEGDRQKEKEKKRGVYQIINEKSFVV